MGWLAYLISLAFWGLIIGAFARLALPGRDPMSLPMTMLVGIGGSFIGGVIVFLATGGRHYRARRLVSLVFAARVVFFIPPPRGRRPPPPGARPPPPRQYTPPQRT